MCNFQIKFGILCANDCDLFCISFLLVSLISVIQVILKFIVMVVCFCMETGNTSTSGHCFNAQMCVVLFWSKIFAIMSLFLFCKNFSVLYMLVKVCLKLGMVIVEHVLKYKYDLL